MTTNPPTDAVRAAALLVADARRAVHESLIVFAAPEADRVRALIADLETAVEGRTAIRFSAVSVPASAPTTQPALRDRIAETLAEADGWKWADGFKAHSPTWQRYQQVAAAVLAVLPAPADRAAILHEAADLAEEQRQFEPASGARKSAQVSENVGIVRVADKLRRVAGETQPECTASISGDCLREAESETACDTEAGECVHGGRPGGEAQQSLVVHAIPRPGSNGISACCNRAPCEFIGERVTRDPNEVTCPGPAAVAQPDEEA